MHSADRNRFRFYPFIIIFFICYGVESNYPIGTRQCYSTLTKPDGKLICPEGRRDYCVKEISSLQKDLCGKTQYYGDVYEGSQCVFRKCAKDCVAGKTFFSFGGVQYSRQTYCCHDHDFCNAALGGRSTYVWVVISIIGFCIFSILFWS